MYTPPIVSLSVYLKYWKQIGLYIEMAMGKQKEQYLSNLDDAVETFTRYNLNGEYLVYILSSSHANSGSILSTCSFLGNASLPVSNGLNLHTIKHLKPEASYDTREVQINSTEARAYYNPCLQYCSPGYCGNTDSD
jgi:hypothetical protein